MGSRGSAEIDQAIRVVAQAQLGLISTGQALQRGIGPQLLAQRRSIGMLANVFPRVMRLLGHPQPSFQRLLAAVLAVPGGVLCGPSAAVLMGFPIGRRFTNDAAPVVIAVEATRVIRIPGITAIRRPAFASDRPWMGVRMSSPADTIVLLPRFATVTVVERCLDFCLAERLASVASIRAALERHPPTAVAGRKQLLTLLDVRSGGMGHRSQLERRVAPWLKAAGLIGWVSNHRVPVGSDAIEVDYAWVRQRVALEISPFYTHGSRAKQERDVVRRRALARHGWTVIEATDPDLTGPQAFQRVVAALRALTDM